MHQIDAVDVDEHVGSGAVVLQFGVVVLAGVHHVRRDHLLVAAVEVKQEAVDGFQALGDAAGDGLPLISGDQPGKPIGGHGAELARVQHESERVQRGGVVGFAPPLAQSRNAETFDAVHEWLVEVAGGPVGVQVFVQFGLWDIAGQH